MSTILGRYYRVHHTRAGVEIHFGEKIEHDGYLEAWFIIPPDQKIELQAPIRAWDMLLRNRFVLGGYNADDGRDQIVKHLEEQGFKEEG